MVKPRNPGGKSTTWPHAYTRERNRSRREIRVLDCREVTPAQVDFAGARLIARLRRRAQDVNRFHRASKCLSSHPRSPHGWLVGFLSGR